MGSISSAATIVLLFFLSFSLSFSSSFSPVTKSPKSQLLSKRSLFDAEIDEKSMHKLKKKPILPTKNQIKLLKPKKSNFADDDDGAAISKATKITKDKANKAAAAAAAADDDDDDISEVTESTKIKMKKTSAADAVSQVTDSTKLKLGKSLSPATQKLSNSTKLPKSIKPTKSNSTKLSKSEAKSSGDSSSVASTNKSSKKSDLDAPPARKIAGNGRSVAKSKSDFDAPPAKKKAGDGGSRATLKSDLDAPPAKNKTAKPGRSKAWMEELDDGGTDLISDLRELPSRLLPELERLSSTSKSYISAANRGIAAGMRPYVGSRAAPRVAPVLSILFLALPLTLLALLFRRLRDYLSLRRLLIFIQAYFAIYFATLAATSLLTGLEPLRFFYATSPASYAWTQAAQTMGYLMYLVAQLADLVAVFADGKEQALGGGEEAAAARVLGLTQIVIALGVGSHYYAAVFQRAVAGEPPRANWRVHAAYAACFVVICACARADKRKKLYEGGEDGKTN